MKKEYLGDGVYARFYDHGSIMLTAEDGIETTATIHLDDDTFEALLRFVGEVQRVGACDCQTNPDGTIGRRCPYHRAASRGIACYPAYAQGKGPMTLAALAPLIRSAITHSNNRELLTDDERTTLWTLAAKMEEREKLSRAV